MLKMYEYRINIACYKNNKTKYCSDLIDVAELHPCRACWSSALHSDGGLQQQLPHLRRFPRRASSN